MSQMNKVFIGIDPGKDGALGVIREDPRNLPLGEERVYAIPFDIRRYAQELHDLREVYGVENIRAVVEHVNAMPGQGSVSMFHFGENFGMIQGVLISEQISYELVRPQKWKKEFSCTSDKNTSIQVAQRLFPNVDLRRTERCKGPHDGVCEALLMAEYARRRLNG